MLDKLGEKVNYFRKSKGLSIRKLAENLCDESTIFRLEKGKQLPRLEILNDICMKLEIPLQALFPFNEEVEALKKSCRELTYKEDYVALELILERCYEALEKLNSTFTKNEFRKFILWHKAIILHKKENDVMAALNTLNTLVTIKTCGSELDYSMLNSIGLIHLSIKDVNSAVKIYEIIYPKVKSQKVRDDLTLLPRVGYNYADSLYKSNNYELALRVIEEIFCYLQEHHLNYTLGEIYHMKGILLKNIGHLEEAEEAFKNAVLVFSLTKDKINLVRTELDISNLRCIKVSE